MCRRHILSITPYRKWEQAISCVGVTQIQVSSVPEGRALNIMFALQRVCAAKDIILFESACRRHAISYYFFAPHCTTFMRGY